MAKKSPQERDGAYQRKDLPGCWISWTDARGRANFLGALLILACVDSGNDRLTEASRQGCLRSQEICHDSFDAVFRGNRANCQFALPFLRSL